MKVPVFLLLSTAPAFAHTTALPHGHSLDWAVPLALVLIGVAALVARREAVRARDRRK